MAIGRISGALLFSDLDRQSTDLAFTTNGKPLTYMDFTNFRFGVNTNSVVDTFTVTGTANVSGVTKIYGNLVAVSGTAASSVSTGALVIVGGVGVSGNLYAGNLIATNFVGNITSTGGSSIFSNIGVTFAGAFGSINTANAVISGGYISSLTNAYITTSRVTNFSTANAVISGGYISALSNITATTGNVSSWYAAGLNSTSANITTAYVGNISTANAVISGGYISALTNAYITTSRITNFSTANAVISGGYISALSNVTATTGNVGSWYATVLNSTSANITTAYAGNFSTANAVISGGYISGMANAVITTANIGNIQILDTTISSITGNVTISPLLSNDNALVIVGGTSALQLPTGSNVQQPTTAYAGAIRWNTTSSIIEYYNGLGWISLIGQINNQIITPDNDGVNKTFSLDYSATAEGIIVSINGTLQQPGAAYTVAGTLITFAEAPVATDIISIRYIASGVARTAFLGGNVDGATRIANTTTSTSTTTGALIVDGGTGIAGNLAVGGNVFQQSAYYESFGNISNTGGNLTCNFNTGAVFYVNSLTANVTANFTNVNAVTGTVTGATVIVNQGVTAYQISNVQVNGAMQTVRWSGATVPTGTASNTDVMSFSLINLGAGGWRVLGQISNYG